MKSFLNFTYFFGFIILLINNINAQNDNGSINVNTNISNEDNYNVQNDNGSINVNANVSSEDNYNVQNDYKVQNDNGSINDNANVSNEDNYNVQNDNSSINVNTNVINEDNYNVQNDYNVKDDNSSINVNTNVINEDNNNVQNDYIVQDDNSSINVNTNVINEDNYIVQNDYNVQNDNGSINVNTTVSNEDNYYLIFIENKLGEYRIFKDKNNKNKKRDESAIFVESLLDEFNTIILDNKDTYHHPEVINEIEEKSQLRRRSEISEGDFEYNYNESDVIFPISSIGDTVVFYAYLSKELAEEFSKKPNVIACEPDIGLEDHAHYNVNDIINQTGWKNSFKTRLHADSHLSLISQGKYSSSLVSEYDDTYYYPVSGGKGANIIVIDSAFDFSHDEFQSGNRKARCIAEIKNAKITSTNSLKCGVNIKNNHGKLISDIAAGKKHGVAPNANIYGINIPYDENGKKSNADFISALQAVYEVYSDLSNLIINISFGTYETTSSALYKQCAEATSTITKKGGIIVASASNHGKKLTNPAESFDIPCQFGHIICVGGINNKPGISMDDVYEISEYSNYGDGVNIYAPFYTVTEYIDSVTGNYMRSTVGGNSYSTPIVAGIIATIMSENPSRIYNNVDAFNQLVKLSVDNVYIDGYSRPIANNGKHIVYSLDGKYYGCGTYAGNLPCNTNNTTPISTVSGRCGPSYGACSKEGQCCSEYGYCGTADKYCGKGCQSEFGRCNSVSSKVATTTTKKSVATSTVSGKCGPSYGACSTKGQCCSKYGYCGKSNDYCGTGCQSEYGICN